MPGTTPDPPLARAEHPAARVYPTLPQLDSLEFLVATKMDRPEQWQTFVALLRLAGYEPTPDGVRRIGS